MVLYIFASFVWEFSKNQIVAARRCTPEILDIRGRRTYVAPKACLQIITPYVQMVPAAPKPWQAVSPAWKHFQHSLTKDFTLFHIKNDKNLQI
jgi:hypothetical protein